jgi:hypothetical protein
MQKLFNQQQEAVNKFRQARILDLLQWTPGTYNIFLYNSGLEYLTGYFQSDANAVASLESRIEFWNWWKALWRGRDEAYLEDIDGREDEINVKTREQLYQTTHNVNILVAEIYPPRHVYPAGFVHTKIEIA